MQTTVPSVTELTPEMKAIIDTYLEQHLNKKIDDAIRSRMEVQLANLKSEILALMPKSQDLSVKENEPQSVTIVLSSNDFDRVLPAYIIATGAASFGMKVTIFATLWGLTTLRKKTTYGKKKITEQMITMMTPSLKNLGLSKMNMFGVGASMMKSMLKSNNVSSLPELMELASEMGVDIIACQMTMGIMGVTCEEIRDGVSYAGVAKYIERASHGTINLFI